MPSLYTSGFVMMIHRPLDDACMKKSVGSPHDPREARGDPSTTPDLTFGGALGCYENHSSGNESNVWPKTIYIVFSVLRGAQGH